MKTAVYPLIDGMISDVIQFWFGPVFTDRDSQMMNYCQSMGEVYLGYVDDKLLCCWGLIPPSWLSNSAYLWMWGPEPMPHQFTFVRQSQIQVRDMLDRFPEITGHCAQGARSAQRWIRWLGGEFAGLEDRGIRFYIRRK